MNNKTSYFKGNNYIFAFTFVYEDKQLNVFDARALIVTTQKKPLTCY